MNNTRIVFMNGGLGNQLYQYAFMRLLELVTKEPCMVDDAAFCVKKPGHNGYELEKIFGLKLNLLSRYFSEDVWAEMMRRYEQGVGIPQQLLDNGLNLTMIEEFPTHSFSGNIVRFPQNRITEDLLYTYANTQGCFYYCGYWCIMDLVRQVRKSLLQELVFPELDALPNLPAENLQYAARIDETDSVAVHIRRGDFTQCGRALSPEKYYRAVKKMEESYPGCTYFVFSDDILWCQEHREELGLTETIGEVVYVTGNCGNGYNYVDMQLMSKCKKMIISNSTFGLWAFYLNQTPDLVAFFADNM